MGLLDLANGNSFWRGFDYYRDKKVLNLRQIGEHTFSALVNGSKKTPYQVEIDLEHPRKSRCNCPHADGKRIVCKHMTAVYFTVFPEEAERIYQKAIAEEKKEEQRQEQKAEELTDYVYKMKKEELREALLELLFYGPEWQYDRFLQEHLIDG